MPEPLLLEPDSEFALLPLLSLVGVLGGVLNGSPFSSAVLAVCGAKPVPLNKAAVSRLIGFWPAGIAVWVASASASVCSTVHSGASARSFGGSSENRLA